MIKDNQKYFNRLHLVLDAVVVAASYMLAWYLKFASPFSNSDPSVGALSMGTYFEMLIVIVPGCLMLYYAFNLYTAKRATVHKYEILNIFQANTVGLIILMAGWYMVSQIHFSRLMMGYFYVLNIIFTTLGRSLIRILPASDILRYPLQLLPGQVSGQRKSISTASTATRSGDMW